ncbi:DinB family protein [Chitinophaga sp. MM2321]|uniref:DinB family protein n=1 Tax=Chitinophaga sp. MM2321 TaxID=3137178 RepID=UPI0032D587E3
MKKILFALFILFTTHTYGQDSATPTPTLKSILLAQLKSTHNVKDWFVPVNIAVEGLTPAQANWKDSSGNHSIGQLVQHLIFWNQRQLDKFNGKPEQPFSGDNNETFSAVDQASWDATVKKIDTVLTELEKVIEQSDEQTLAPWYTIIAHISAHNAYHIGQMLYIRKQQGSWNPENGVK